MTTQTFIQTQDESWQNLAQFLGTAVLPLAEPVKDGSIHRLKMKAGATIPVHAHPCDEYVYVLAGEIKTGKQTCGAGTFWITPANSHQGKHQAITDVELLTIRLGKMGVFEST